MSSASSDPSASPLSPLFIAHTLTMSTPCFATPTPRFFSYPSRVLSPPRRRRPPLTTPFHPSLSRNYPRSAAPPPARKPPPNLGADSPHGSQPPAPSQPPSTTPASASSNSTATNDLVPISFGPISTSISARSLLYIVPALWGSFAPAVRFLFAQEPHQPVSVFNSERLLLSTLIYLPILVTEFRSFVATPPEKRSADRLAFFWAGIELGVYVFLANVAQVIGLKQTSASRAAFLVQLQTVFVPVLGTALGVDSISLVNGISSAIAVAGVALLSSDKSHNTASSLTGDALEVLSALFFTAYIVRLGKFCTQDIAPNSLVATKIAAQAFFSIIWAVVVEFNQILGPASVSTGIVPEAQWTLSAIAINVGVVLWTGLLSSAASGWAQTKGQQSASPSEAVLIFATQPLWATALAALVLGESFGPRGVAGGALIVTATLVPTLAERYFKKDAKQVADDSSKKDEDMGGEG